MFTNIIPKNKEDLVSTNPYYRKVYKTYIPKKGDIFYYANWWLGSAITGGHLALNFNYVMYEAYYKSNKPKTIILKKIYDIGETTLNLNIEKTLYNGEYKVSNTGFIAGKEIITYLNNTEVIEKIEKPEHILDIENNYDNLIIAKTFEQLIVNIGIFNECLNVDITQKLDKIFSTRLENLNKLSLKYEKFK